MTTIPATVEPPVRSERDFTAAEIREWISHRGYLPIEAHNKFGHRLPTTNLGRCMAALADALEEIEQLRLHPQPAAVAPTMSKVEIEELVRLAVKEEEHSQSGCPIMVQDLERLTALRAKLAKMGSGS